MTDVYNQVSPESLWIVSHSGQQQCSGEYELVKGELSNGKPLWKKSAMRPEDELWLYSNKLGFWCIAGPDARSKNFDCDVCFIYRKKLPTGDATGLPHAVLGGMWQWWDESKKTWCDDALIKASEVRPSSKADKLEIALREVAKLRSLASSRSANQEPFHDIETRVAELLLLDLDLTAPVFSDEDGGTLLMLAAHHNWKDFADTLCSSPTALVNGGRQAYLDARSTTTGWTALFCAVRQGHLSMAERLLDSKATPDIQSFSGGLTPLMLAADAGRSDLCKALLEARANPSTTLRNDHRGAMDFARIVVAGTESEQNRTIKAAGRSEALKLIESAAANEFKIPATNCIWSEEACAKRRRKRAVHYTGGARICIRWHYDPDLKEVLVKELSSTDSACQVGIKPGWALLSIDGSSQLVQSFRRSMASGYGEPSLPDPPVTLEFGRPLDYPDELWRMNVNQMVEQKHKR
eukprot:TRINITY_DN6557_c0_g5_i1.p1 TRINITY_DN6557_c0_g5~~TRINITY_DN6557_c0_g5_i1.p1  ORF type:complete len:465 (+),score=96.44 TRINITY_DN6557_c0_g5_i1:46-1440(+)